MRKEWRQSKVAEKIHNEWCKENGYPVRAASINPIELRKQQASSIKNYNNSDYKASSSKHHSQ